MKIYILSSGLIGCDMQPEAAFKTKKNMESYISKKYPDARWVAELYWEDDTMCLTAQKLPIL
jgi:hypothetical protein